MNETGQQIYEERSRRVMQSSSCIDCVQKNVVCNHFLTIRPWNELEDNLKNIWEGIAEAHNIMFRHRTKTILKATKGTIQ